MQIMVRVEIHHANGEMYERLHAAMSAEGFTHTLTAESNGKQYHAPIGTYWTEAYTDRWAALYAAKRAASPIDPKAEVMACSEGRIVFIDCPQVPEFSFASMLGSTLLTAQPAPRRLGSLLAPPPKPETSNLGALYSLLGDN